MTYKYQKPHSAKQTILRWFAITILLVLTGTAGTWIWSGRLKGPVIQIKQPEQFIGQQTQLEVILDTPVGNFSRINIVLEQDGRTLPVFTLEDLTDAEISQSTPNQISIIRQIGSRVIPDLASGQARLIVQASRLRDGTRKITHITEVVGMEGDTVTLQDLFLFEFEQETGGEIHGSHRSLGLRPKFWDKALYFGLEEKLAAALELTAIGRRRGGRL